jgi:hypothetical protein
MTCTLAVEALTLGDVTTSGKGAKTAPFYVNQGPADFTLPALQIAFEPSAYQNDDATRVNLVLKVGLVHEPDLSKIDEWILDAVSADPVKYFGKAKSRESIEETYTPCLRKSEKWGSQFKAKVNMPGSAGACACGRSTSSPEARPTPGPAASSRAVCVSGISTGWEPSGDR